jgi:cysteine desulfurase
MQFLRIILENALAEAAPDLILVEQAASRLPNTVAAAVPGWAGETQVMAMDLAGFAVSAGAACGSGRVRGGRVLEALGHGAVVDSAIRVSIGPGTTEAELLRFARSWAEAYRRRRSRAA